MNYLSITQIKNISLLVISVFLLSSCGSETGETENVLDAIPTIQSANTFYSIPSPIELGQIIKKSGADFNNNILNPVENASNYSSTTSKALNLGVYSSNLSYAAAYYQLPIIFSNLACAKRLTEDLGIPNKFSIDMQKRIEKNSNNKDSLDKIMSELFLSSNEALKEHDMSSVSVLVIAGGYIEGMYVGTQVAKSVKDKKAIYSLLGEFKGSLNQIIMMISTIHDDNFSDVLSDLKSIKAIYDESSSQETAINTTEAGETKDNTLSNEQIQKLTTLVEIIRNKIVKSV